MKRDAQVSSQRRKMPVGVRGSNKLSEIMVIAEQEGLLQGERTQVVRGECPRRWWQGQKSTPGSIPTRISLKWRLRT